jgi:hypothetical protein
MRAPLKMTLAFGLVGGMLGLAASPAEAQLFGRRVVVVQPTYVAPAPAVATTVVAPAPIVYSAPAPTVYSAPVVPTTVAPSEIVPTSYTATTYGAPVPTAYYPAYAAPVATVYAAPVVVRRSGRIRVVAPRRVYYYPY